MADTEISIGLDDLQTPIGFYDMQGNLLQANFAIDIWCEGQIQSLTDVLQDKDFDRLLSRIDKAEQIVRRSAVTSAGRKFPAEFMARKFSNPQGVIGILVEARDASRTEQKELMLNSFSKVIDESNRKLRMQTAELSGLLNGMRQAVFAVNAELQVAAPVSRHAAVVFGCEMENAPILDTLFAQIDRTGDLYSRVMTVLLTVYGADELQWEMLCDQLPDRIEYLRPQDDAPTLRTLDITYSPLWNADGALDRIIFAVTDATEKIALQAAIEQERSSNRQTLQRLEQLAACDPTALEIFFANTVIALKRMDEAIRGEQVKQETVQEIFRHAHTIKGNARVLGLTGVIEAAHRFESKIAALRDELAMPGHTYFDWAIARSLLNVLRMELRAYSRPAQQVFRIEDVFTRDLVIELEGLCDAISIALVMHQSGFPDAIPDLRRALHSAKGLARLLDDDALTETLHAAEALPAIAFPVMEPALQSSLAEMPGMQSIFTHMLPHCEMMAASIATAPDAEMIADLNLWARHMLDGALADLVSAAHRYAARAEAKGMRWLASGYRQLEALASASDQRAWNGMVRAILSFLYARVALGMAMDAARLQERDRQILRQTFNAKGEADGDIIGRFGQMREMLDLDWTSARTGSRTLANMAELWGQDARNIANELFGMPLQQSWGVTAISAATHAMSVQEARAALDAADIPDQGLGRSLRRYLSLGLALPSYAPRSELMRLFKQDIDSPGDAIRPARRMRKVSEQALETLEMLLADPGADKEQLVNAASRILAVPADTIVAPFVSMVGDLAQSLGKRARLNVLKDSALLAKSQASRISEALLHLLRNAVDHGLELPDERERNGKDATGEISVAIEQINGLIQIVVTDDGKGIDVDSVIRAARTIGKNQLDGEVLSKQDALRLILLPGLSTARNITQVSGRGVGMDVVADNIKQLSGQIDIESTPGQGCRFRLTIPALVRA